MKILVSGWGEQNFGFLLEDGRLREVFPADRNGDALCVGDIILGRITAVVPSLRACFISLISGTEREEKAGGPAFLPFSELAGEPEKLRPQQLLPVQISALPMGTKPCRVTGKLSLDGRYCVAGLGYRGVSVSKKLSGAAAEFLKKSCEAWNASESGSIGLIIRTNAGELAEQQNPEPLLEESRELSRRLSKIVEESSVRTGFSVLYRALGELERQIRDRNPAEVIVDIGSLGASFDESRIPDGLLRRYEDANGGRYLTVMGLERQLRGALSRQVWLKSGAYLIFDRTEALTVVDVNSGKSSAAGRCGRKSSREAAENAAFAVNCEAAEEIFRQLRLRNLSGMILVDFINMDERHRELLGERLRELCCRDPQKTVWVDFTALGLAEITRKKAGAPLEALLTKP
ncbi:ribonuclease E/G [Lachnoclostridium sp. Marseille-P6806]|uniref:ribonuclease E/G n=1 Tax=Lachnoclostridium sp. Marseille-P6806 TaxID=2364793 RepID=UPI0013EEEDE3|nr:ribonuclease E/G [Lachnoclostridium sp. Marseille-P6806]